jgi:hypothetical protein
MNISCPDSCIEEFKGAMGPWEGGLDVFPWKNCVQFLILFLAFSERLTTQDQKTLHEDRAAVIRFKQRRLQERREIAGGEIVAPL